MKDITRSVAVATVILLGSRSALAAEPAGTPPDTGTIQSVESGAFRLRTADMQELRDTLGEQSRIVNTVSARLSQLHGGDFIGTTAETRSAKLVSTEVHISFAEALRGTGEGHRSRQDGGDPRG